jgi:hypothetical protein
MDLGCGDGKLLEAAFEFCATGFGLEIDPTLARSARDRLRLHGCDFLIIEHDLFAYDFGRLDPTVIFAYLTRAALQRVSKQFAKLDAGTRIVTIEMPIPDWEWTERHSGCYLYQLPARRRPVPETAGWPVPGYIIELPADQTASFSMVVTHPEGMPSFGLSEGIFDVGSIAIGAECLSSPGRVAIDLQWNPMPHDTVRIGTLTSPAIGAILIIVKYSKECRSARVVGLDAEKCQRILDESNHSGG